MSKTYTVDWLEVNWKHAHRHWFISLRQQDHAFLGSALHFIQNILVHLCLCKHSHGAQVGSICRMQL